MSRIVDVIVAVTCVVLLTLVLFRQFRPAVELAAAENSIQVGTAFAKSEDGYLSADRTVVLFLHSQCRYCTESMALYRQLKERADGQPAGSHRFDLKVRGVEPVGVLQSYLSSNGISNIPVKSQPDLSGLKGTPSLVVLDRKGLVVASWTGTLSNKQTEQLWRVLE